MACTPFVESEIEAGALKFRRQVVGVECGIIRHPLHAALAKQPGINPGPQEHAHVATEGAEAAD